DRPETARRMSLYWGVTSLETEIVQTSPEQIIKFVVDWSRKKKILEKGSRIVLVSSTDWSAAGKNLMLVHAVE
ncbi:MAG: pyruvate kinase, partial [Planctomycetes bacterium]|nr:pyruvate kinase [Planctomycetota bacterium]